MRKHKSSKNEKGQKRTNEKLRQGEISYDKIKTS